MTLSREAAGRLGSHDNRCTSHPGQSLASATHASVGADMQHADGQRCDELVRANGHNNMDAEA